MLTGGDKNYVGPVKCLKCGTVYQHGRSSSCPNCGHHMAAPHDQNAEAPSAAVEDSEADIDAMLESATEEEKAELHRVIDREFDGMEGNAENREKAKRRAAEVLKEMRLVASELAATGPVQNQGAGSQDLAGSGEAGGPTGPSGPLPADLGPAPDAAGGEPKPTE